MEKYLYLKSLGDGSLKHLEEILSKDKIRYRIGCDSINIKHNSVYIMSLVGIYPGNSGAFVYYHKEKVPKIKNLQERLWKEVELAVSFATFLRDTFSADIEAIDFDLNADPQYPSNRLHASAIGYATAEGFNACAKPDKIYAIWSSDQICHKKQKTPKFPKPKGKKKNAIV